MDSKMKRILTLFLTFFKIGAFTFGGGYAMIPLIQKETVENKKWITDDDILEIIAIAEERMSRASSSGDDSAAAGEVAELPGAEVFKNKTKN